MQAALDWLTKNHEGIVRGLADLCAIPSISTDGEHADEIERTAKLTCDQMRGAGLTNVEVLRVGTSLPYAYGEWCEAGPDKPTVFLYAHHDVQPINFVQQWKSDPWKLTRRDGRLFARGAADDKGAISALLGAVAAYRQTDNTLPVNIKMVVEGEEEIGSRNLLTFFEKYRDRIKSDVIVVCDTENIDVGLPCLTYSLRGVVALNVEVTSAAIPVHSGMAGGALPDAALALNAVLARLCWGNGPLPIPGFYDSVRPLTDRERAAVRRLPFDEAKIRRELGVVPSARLAVETGLSPYEQTWRRPSVTVIAQEASSLKGASNQVLPNAAAIVSCRIVPDQNPDAVAAQLKAYLEADPPWGVEVKVTPHGAHCDWWATDPAGPAFEAALAALRVGYDRDPVAIGCGGSIGFVGPLAELFGGGPGVADRDRRPGQQRPRPEREPARGGTQEADGESGAAVRQLGKIAGRAGEVTKTTPRIPRKVRELMSDLERAGYVYRGRKGPHRNYEHPSGCRVTLSGQTGDDAKPYQETGGTAGRRGDEVVSDAARYVEIVEWSDLDGAFVGRCPGVIGPCCHGTDEVAVYAELCDIVADWLEIAVRDGRPLPPATAGSGRIDELV